MHAVEFEELATGKFGKADSVQCECIIYMFIRMCACAGDTRPTYHPVVYSQIMRAELADFRVAGTANLRVGVEPRLIDKLHSRVRQVACQAHARHALPPSESTNRRGQL